MAACRYLLGAVLPPATSTCKDTCGVPLPAARRRHAAQDPVGGEALTLNGIQTQSAKVYNLLGDLPALKASGVDVARAAAVRVHAELLAPVRRAIDGEITPAEAFRAIPGPDARSAQQWFQWHGKPGLRTIRCRRLSAAPRRFPWPISPLSLCWPVSRWSPPAAPAADAGAGRRALNLALGRILPKDDLEPLIGSRTSTSPSPDDPLSPSSSLPCRHRGFLARAIRPSCLADLLRSRHTPRLPSPWPCAKKTADTSVLQPPPDHGYDTDIGLAGQGTLLRREWIRLRSSPPQNPRSFPAGFQDTPAPARLAASNHFKACHPAAGLRVQSTHLRQSGLRPPDERARASTQLPRLFDAGLTACSYRLSLPPTLHRVECRHGCCCSTSLQAPSGQSRLPHRGTLHSQRPRPSFRLGFVLMTSASGRSAGFP